MVQTPYLAACRELVEEIIAARRCSTADAVDLLAHLLPGAPESVQCGVIAEIKNRASRP